MQGADKGDLTETLQKVAGFYLHFEDEKVTRYFSFDLHEYTTLIIV